MNGLSLRSVQDTLGLSRGVIAGLIAAGFVTPTRGARNAYRFSFQDVVLLRTAVDLQAAHIGPRRIVAALKKLRAALPADLPLTGLRIDAVGSDVTVRTGGTRWHAESGQQLLDFEVVPMTGSVTLLPRPIRSPGSSSPFLSASEPVSETTRRPRDAPSRADTTAPHDAAAARNDQASALFERAEALEATDTRAAEATYRQAMTTAPERADIVLNLGALLCDAERFGEAVALFDRALVRFPADASLHFNRAIALEDQGRDAEALAAYEACLRLEPTLADAHFNAARLHEKMGDAKKAVRHLSAYRRLQP